MVKIILNLILILIYNYAIFYCLFPQVRSYGIQIDDLNKQIKNLNKQIKNLNEQIKKQNIKDNIKVIKKD